MPSRNNAHPDPLALVRHAFEVHDPALSRHLSQCPSCAEEVRRFEAAKSALRIMATAGEAGPECLGDDTLSALAEGTLEPSSRGEVMLHLTRCTHCRTAVGSLARALADPEVVAARVAADRAPARRFSRLAVPVAAAAVLLIAVLGRQGGEDRPSPVHRAPAITAADQPAAIAPLGAGARPDSLRWNTVAGADLYRVTLFRADGRVLYETQLRDTAAGLPDTIGLIAGSSYLWMVEARTGFDRWSSSQLFRFSIDADTAR